ncbi:hypothetical protein EUGRSUZ_C02041 [Eucalyptus grandis]|uniref:Uncharacterized protein n=2 Tax=Eucalyptus grandis TaxID=71139 RepID=A0ACC3LGI2_EUCGR|nr:hypothetical protein EUGRSUZ_C02041 [Eucalyptus grandis]
MFRQFDGWSFLESVREYEERQLGLKFLQRQLFSDLLGETHGQISSFEERIKLLKDQFVCMKFLIVLDDVGASFQLEQILRNPDWLGSGSRIIITTRKVQALAKLKGSRIHEVVGMQKGDALKIFHTQAFRERPVPNEFDTLSKEIVSTIDWRPSTIDIVGSYLYSKTKGKWEQTLNKQQKVDELKEVPRPRVQQKLKVIIDALPKKQRQIFLDIARFLRRQNGSVLKVLVDLSIVKIENGKLWMHDELQDLGRDIALPKNLEPEKCSRLWSHQRALDVLENKKGTVILNGVLLEFGSQSHRSFGPAHFAGILRWLHWQGCPWNLRAKNLDLEELKAKKLKVLNLTGCVHLIKTPDLSHFKCLERLILERCMRLDEIGPSVKSLQCLVSLNLRFCTKLKKLPCELGSLTSLEDILIDETAIQEIPTSIDDLQKLKRFSACNCLSLTQLLESISHLRVLQYLSISNCRSILSLPMSMGTLASLSELDLSSTGINELPDTVIESSLLRVLKIDSTFVRKLPAAIWKLKRLEELHASGCRNLEGKIPKQIKMLSALKVLKLGYSRICGLLDSISGLPNLQTLDLLHCDQLREVPELPSSLISLYVSSKLMDRIPDISSLVKLGELLLGEGSQEPVLPVRDKIEKKECTLQLGSLLELKILQLSMLKIQLLPVGLHYLYKLRKLSLCCIHLKKLPRLPPGLFTLSLHHCKSQTMPDLSYLVLLNRSSRTQEVQILASFQSISLSFIQTFDLLFLENDLCIIRIYTVINHLQIPGQKFQTYNFTHLSNLYF